MTYQLVKRSEYDVRGMLPPHIYEKLSDKNTYIFCGEEDGEQVSVAVFSGSYIHSGEVILEYIQVTEALRGKRYARKLLEYCYDTFSQRGIKRIYCKCCDHLEGLQRMYKFLLREDFIPLTFDGHMMEYYLQDLQDSSIMKRMLEQYEQLPNVMTITDVKHPYLKDFMVRCKEMQVCLNRNVCDLEWSHFYVRYEKIVGAIFAKRVDERTLHVPIIYIDKAHTDIKAFLLLMTACVQQAKQRMRSDSRIQLQIFGDELYHGMRKMCDDMEFDYLLQEYIRILD